MENKIFIVTVPDLKKILNNESISNYRKVNILNKEEDLEKRFLDLVRREKLKFEYCAIQVELNVHTKEIDDNDRRIIHKNFFMSSLPKIKNIFFLYRNTKEDKLELMKFNFNTQKKYIEAIIEKKLTI